MTETGQSGFFQALGWAVLNSLWQMALLWLVFQILSGFLTRKKHAQKSFFAAFLLIAGFAW